ncbi:hypothetical protein DPMN_094496 [Dreissena polymorpha]|uniref:Dynein axonemal light chain 1 n=1 Tax=Dreissena polymorpha TaxID=45954 RepID=A0A9D4L4V1_DREPO|nr:hypothetical protein DPMN_094496 [Dreissena polymorpha]
MYPFSRHLPTFSCFRQLSLSTNQIEKIANLNGLKNLKILFLGRNNIKSLTGLEAVGDTLEELWISYNVIEKLKGINVLKKLRVLYMIHNKVADLTEFNKLTELQNLEMLTFMGNPLADRLTDEGTYQTTVQKTLRQLKQLDGETVIRHEEEQ